MPRPKVLSLAALGALAVLTSACQSSDAYNTNRPDDRPDSPKFVVRTPVAISSDLPYATPPVEIPLPGVNGGLPGEPDPNAGEAHVETEDQ